MHGLLKLRDESSVRINHLISICRNAACSISCGISCGSGFTGRSGMSKAVDRMTTTFMHAFLKLGDESSVRINHLIAIRLEGCRDLCRMSSFMHGLLQFRDECPFQ